MIKFKTLMANATVALSATALVSVASPPANAAGGTATFGFSDGSTLNGTGVDASGEPIYSFTITASAGPSDVFSDIPVYANGTYAAGHEIADITSCAGMTTCSATVTFNGEVVGIPGTTASFQATLNQKTAQSGAPDGYNNTPLVDATLGTASDPGGLSIGLTANSQIIPDSGSTFNIPVSGTAPSGDSVGYLRLLANGTEVSSYDCGGGYGQTCSYTFPFSDDLPPGAVNFEVQSQYWDTHGATVASSDTSVGPVYPQLPTTISASHLTIVMGQTAALRGNLTYGDAATPLAGAPLAITGKSSIGTWSRAVTTNSRGAFTVTLPSNAKSTIAVSFAGAPNLLPSKLSTGLTVLPRFHCYVTGNTKWAGSRLTVHCTSPDLPNGQPVSVRASGVSAWFCPGSGQTEYVQARTGGSNGRIRSHSASLGFWLGLAKTTYGVSVNAAATARFAAASWNVGMYVPYGQTWSC